MVKVTLPKNEYQQLKRQAEAYRKFVAQLFESVVQDPISKVVKDFQKTNLYTEGFLKDLESGLHKSSYTKKYGNQTTKKRS